MSDYTQRIQMATRSVVGVSLGLTCGHLALRPPNYQIPKSMETDCEECAAKKGGAL